MPREMTDGENRVIKASRRFAMWKHKAFGVEAHRIDSETPYVSLITGDRITTLTDTETADLIDRLQRALRILPTSK